jgi:hypothetical protein
MTSGAKAIIGLGSIWGLYAFGALLISSFTIGANDTAPEIVGIALYGLTLLPSCILAIWRRKIAAIWLIALPFLTAFGLTYQVIHDPARGHLGEIPAKAVINIILFAGIPIVIGTLLLGSARRESIEPDISVQDGKQER